jgi:phenylalanyl-tRNA synthetase alpha chain
MDQSLDHLKQDMQDFYNTFLKQISLCHASKRLSQIKTEFLGHKNILTGFLKELRHFPLEERKARSQILNAIQEKITHIIHQKNQELVKKESNEQLKKDFINITQPISSIKGALHPLMKTMDEMAQWFLNQGFLLQDGPEIETGYYNFTALNIPASHPSRDSQDTLYLDNLFTHELDGREYIDNTLTQEDPLASAHDLIKIMTHNGKRPVVRKEQNDTHSNGNHLTDAALILRTQTSSVQIRTLEKYRPPLRIVSMGRVYRADPADATHSPMFHQCEGLVVEKNIHMGHLKGFLEDFFAWFFQTEVLVRFRPSFFPFTTLSTEVDIVNKHTYDDCINNKKNIPWLEILGCGMVHPHVLRNMNVDSEIYKGFAFGMGIERLVMIREDIEDIRIFYKNNLSWLCAL